MKRILFLMLCCILAIGQAHAKIWRINNQSAVPTDYREGQAAHDAASPGDSLYFESSPIRYEAFTITKQLTVIGLGGYLSTYSDYQIPGSANANIASININFGGSGTVITGVQANIRVQDVGNIRLYKNYGDISLKDVGSSFIYHSVVGRLSISKSLLIALTNNIIDGIIETGSDCSDIAFHNNTIRGNVFAHHSYFTNNIIVDGGVTLTTSSFNHNVISLAYYVKDGNTISSGDNNVFGMPSASIFTGASSDDRYYQLLAVSPARGAGIDGVDCGATGGSAPYTFNALQPPIPSIYKIEMPSVATGNTMQVTISTRSNN